MESETDESASPTSYELRCLDCSYEATVTGDVFEVLDVIDAHQEGHLEDAYEHFVEFEIEGNGLLSEDDHD